MRAFLAVFSSVALLTAAGTAAASQTFPSEVQNHLSLSYTPPCAICHEGGKGGSGTVTTAFGRAMMSRGAKASDTAALDAALDKMATDKVDSDADGTTDIDALKKGLNPNGATGVAIGAPPVEYGCGGATVARTNDSGSRGVLAGLVMVGAVLVVRRRRALRVLVPLAIGAVAGFSSCNPYQVSYVAPETCLSGKLWTGGESGDEHMNPGLPCIDCHTREGEGPKFTIAGTVFDSSDEKDKCGGSNQAFVYVKGADGKTQKLVPNDMGNFYSKLPVAKPFNVWLEWPAPTAADPLAVRKRVMSASPTTGDCNTCHTQHGENSAPGRIVTP